MEEKKSVLIFLYGGRFTIGNTHMSFYNGKHLAVSQDIQVIIVNLPPQLAHQIFSLLSLRKTQLVRLYRYFADWGNTWLYEGSGADHGVDLHMVFWGSCSSYDTRTE